MVHTEEYERDEMKSAADDNKYELPGAVDFTGVPANCGPAQYPVRTQVEILLAIYEKGGMDRAVLVSDILKATSTHVAARELDVEAERREQPSKMLDAQLRYIFELEQRVVQLEAEAKAAAQVSTEQAGDARDARRYRLLRDAEKIPGQVWAALEAGEGVDEAMELFEAITSPIPFCEPCKAGCFAECEQVFPCTLPAAPSPNNSPVGAKEQDK